MYNWLQLVHILYEIFIFHFDNMFNDYFYILLQHIRTHLAENHQAFQTTCGLNLSRLDMKTVSDQQR